MHRVKQVSRIIVAEIAKASSYALSDGLFTLPFLSLLYTPQCLAIVKCARAVGSAEVDDSAAEAIEVAAFQQGKPEKPQHKDRGVADFQSGC